MKKIIALIAALIAASTMLQARETASETSTEEKVRGSHTTLGRRYISTDSALTIIVAGKKQYYDPTDSLTRDRDILSPKSVNIHPSGTKFYVNSLEGARTVVYDTRTSRKLRTIRHSFSPADSALFARPSGLYRFTHYTDRPDPDSFSGRPVESTFTHGGRYLWVPYYRRSFDINAQDPSAVAVIDTRTDSIIRVFETGPLPKMIAASPDGRRLAITHWGDNTVGLLDISSDRPADWHHTACVTIDYKLRLDFSLTDPVDRDNGSGNALRGTAFTPDGRFLLVGCMGGTGGIAVIDLSTIKYIGKLHGMKPNIRHIVIDHGYLYLSANRSGHVQRIPLRELYAAIASMKNKSATISSWQTVKVDPGARTIALSPDGRYLYAACNSRSTLVIIDTKTMRRIATLPADSYPVGLDVSADDRHVFVTSQGRKNATFAGNCLTIYRIIRN